MPQNIGIDQNYLLNEQYKDASLLSPYFSDIELHRYESSLEIIDVAPLLAYIKSGFRFTVAHGSDTEMNNLLATEMQRGGGVIHIDKVTGLFEAARPIKV